jgi:hypothetical protein
MSLAQHVSALEGVDYEPEPDLDEDFVPITRKISYDVLHPAYAAREPTAEQALPATPAYNHSTVKRAGMCCILVEGTLLTLCSAGRVHHSRVLVRGGNCVWIRRAQTCPC